MTRVVVASVTRAVVAGGHSRLHAITGEVFHLDRLSNEQLGLSPFLVLDGLVDVHDLFTDVLVHFG